MAIERNNSFHLLLSDDELKLLKLLADQEGLNASDYLRMLIRTMPSGSAHSMHAMRIAAMVASKIDLATLFEATSEARRAAMSSAQETKRKKAK